MYEIKSQELQSLILCLFTSLQSKMNQTIAAKLSFTKSKPHQSLHRPSKNIKKHHTCTFEQFYQTRSKSFSIIQNLKSLKTTQTSFIDKDFIDAIDQKVPKKRMSEFIKRKIPPSTKIKTEQIQILRDDHHQEQNKRNLKIFSAVFNRERNKVLSKFESSKEMKQTMLKKLGMKKPKVTPFFDMQRGHIYSFEDRYLQVFRSYNSRQNHKKDVKKVHPLCQIYDQEAKKVIKNYSFQKKNKVQYQPFGKIDYSAHYF